VAHYDISNPLEPAAGARNSREQRDISELDSQAVDDSATWDLSRFPVEDLAG
jgi:hypothetical protein